ncbi:chromate efflux transporter [Fastidiosibacter lacustris]|uniref:chromate efflux transporter n=1 Tax=Fastidiosibacter lacustris TaxID=2056695 RepID=UPI000E34B9EF|nr:chromate efflux transporter [Fastidiosibacter lacustris]
MLKTALQIFCIFLKLGLTSFGGPIAHLGYFHHEFVDRRKWLSEKAYLDVVVLCQFLPGPTSSQVSFAIGLNRAGYLGGIASWLGFTLPSVLILSLFAWLMGANQSWANTSVIHGLKIVAVVIITQAVYSMSIKICNTTKTMAIAIAATCVALLLPFAWAQVLIILFAALFGILLLNQNHMTGLDFFSSKISKRAGALWLISFFILLLVFPVLNWLQSSKLLELFNIFYQTGAMVFGGGHVVLPLLEAKLVQTGLVSQSDFLAGYGLAQAIPSPLFSFAAYLGGIIDTNKPVFTSLVCLIAMFLSGFLLLMAVLPFWQQVCQRTKVQTALKGVNAAVVGLLLAALYQPVWISSILNTKSFVIALMSFWLLQGYKLAPWCIVVFCALCGWLLL